MDLFGSDGSDDSDGEEVQRSAACGVLQFHNGTEDEMLRVVATDAARGDASATLATIDRFCRSRHWMMHVGDVKGAILRAAANRAAPGLWVELGAYCGYSAVLLASQMQSGTLVSLDTEARCVTWSRQLVEHAGLSERVKVMQSSPDETAAEALAREVPSPLISLLFIDHAKDCYLPDLRRIEAAGLLRQGSVVAADNVIVFGLADYLRHVRFSGLYTSSHTFEATLEYDDRGADALVDGVEVSVYAGRTV